MFHSLADWATMFNSPFKPHHNISTITQSISQNEGGGGVTGCVMADAVGKM